MYEEPCRSVSGGCGSGSVAYAQIASGPGVAGMNVDKVVELDLLTQSELADKVKNGWTSAFLVAGGTEIRGPHADDRRAQRAGHASCR